jgi:glycyl-tRNA synthetase beta subunit
MKTTPTLAQFCKAFGCSIEQAKALKAKNKGQLTEMYYEAAKSGKRVNGYTSEQLRQLITGLNIP